jgi:hypothetical protein
VYEGRLILLGVMVGLWFWLAGPDRLPLLGQVDVNVRAVLVLFVGPPALLLLKHFLGIDRGPKAD